MPAVSPLHFTVPDMTCDGCVRAIAAAVHAADPAGQVTADLPAHRIAVTTVLPAAAVMAALDAAGFTPAAIAP